jgi:hypothetical protein
VIRMRLWFFVAGLVAGCQTTREPDTILYRQAGAGVNERAVASIMLCLNQPDCEVLLGEKLQCGPFLWGRLKNHPALANIGEPTRYGLSELGDDGAAHAVECEGRRFGNRNDVRTFWKALLEAFPAGTHERVRTLSDEECRLYWSLTRSDIVEPVFMVQGKHSRLLLQLAGARYRLTLTFIDDFHNVAIRD